MDLGKDEWRGAGLKVSQNISLVKCGCSFVSNIIFALYQLASMASSSERIFT